MCRLKIEEQLTIYAAFLSKHVLLLALVSTKTKKKFDKIFFFRLKSSSSAMHEKTI